MATFKLKYQVCAHHFYMETSENFNSIGSFDLMEDATELFWNYISVYRIDPMCKAVIWMLKNQIPFSYNLISKDTIKILNEPKSFRAYFFEDFQIEIYIDDKVATYIKLKFL